MTITRRYPCADDERRRISDKFTNIFLIHTIEMLWDAGDWLPIPRVMKFYREEARRLQIQPSPLRHRLRRSQIIASIVPWLVSYVYPSQRRWFEQLHLRAWGRAVSFPPADVVRGTDAHATTARNSRKMFLVSCVSRFRAFRVSTQSELIRRD